MSNMQKYRRKKLRSHVINKAINSRIANVLDVNDIIVNVPTNTTGDV